MGYKDCHKQATFVAKISDTASLWCGAATDIRSAPTPWALTISANNDTNIQKPRFFVNKEALGLFSPKLFVASAPKPHFWFDWTDGAAAPVGLDFWEPWVKDLQKVKGNIGLYCMGGHGRTGTCAAIILAFAKVLPPETDVVKFLRKKYCEEVVESKAQVDYLKLLGIETDEKPSRSYYSTGYGTGAIPFPGTNSGAPGKYGVKIKIGKSDEVKSIETSLAILEEAKP